MKLYLFVVANCLLPICIRSASTSNSVMDIAADQEDLSQFRMALESTGLDRHLNNDKQAQHYSIFAPSNNALSSLPSKYFESEYKGHLRNFLEYHVKASDKEAQQDNTPVALMLNNEEAVFHSTETESKVGPSSNGGLTDVVGDLRQATNGAVHTIDTFLTPAFLRTSIVELVAAQDGLGKFSKYLSRLHFDEETSYTVLAPTDQAIEEFETKYAHLRNDPIVVKHIFEQHVLNGIFTREELAQRPSLGSMEIIKTSDSLLARNGIIQKVDTVTIPDEYLKEASEIIQSMTARENAARFFPLMIGSGLLVARAITYGRRNAKR